MVLPLLLALSVTASDAICAVRGWTRQGGTLTVIGAPVKADRFETAAGNAFYAVKTSEGTVFTAADTDYDPIIAFTSAVADFSEIDPASPLWALMTRSVDFACYNPDAFARWQELLAAGSWRRTLLAASQGIDDTDIGDMRVNPLTTSTWGQGTNGICGCYNYYTPGNVVCGCVATAMAQVMYHHRYPTTNVTPVTKMCWYGASGTITNCTMLGGIYEWDKMKPDPSLGITVAESQAIGRLTYDCGVASRMWWRYKGTESATSNQDANTAMYENFGYESATYADCVMDNLGQAVLCNLDAGLPVIFGILGSDGHAVVGDGYGFNGKDKELYVHLNMGWSGKGDLWYHLPFIQAPNNEYSLVFDTVCDVVYNIIPSASANGVFSGRLINESEEPIANYPIRVCDQNGVTLTNLTTNAHGVYGFWTDQSNFTIHTDPDETYASCDSDIQTLSRPGSREVHLATDLGNSWGNELKLTAKPVQVPISTTDTGSVSIEPAWFVDYGYVNSVSDSSGIQSAATQTAANGINSVAECYVIGISPTNETAQFTAEISFSPDGTVKIEHDPDLKDRTYTTKYSIDLKTWYDWTGETPEGAFFKVEVSK